MRNFPLAWLSLLAVATPTSTPAADIRLLVRADDMGSFHAANLACIEACTNGIARSIEVMVPTPWFTEAVKLLKENPQIDVGIHLTLTSEWEACKWGPVSSAPSLVDANGHFFPMVWRNPNLPARSSIQESAWQVADVEKELRVQIEIALRNLPRITHLGSHMGFESLDPRLAQLVDKLRKEYRLQPGSPERTLKYFPGWGKERNPEARIRAFTANLEKLTPGTYFFIEHPGSNSPEMQAVGHKGYEDVAADRDAVTRVFTSPEVKDIIRKKGIRLISYGDLN
jgi:chitin disaccharide deacetylase